MTNRLRILVLLMTFSFGFNSLAEVKLNREDIKKLAKESETGASFTAPIVAFIGAYGLWMVPVATYLGYRIYANGRIRMHNGQFANADNRLAPIPYILNKIRN